MPEQTIDLAGGDFWLVFFVALLALTPIRSARLRPWIWAFCNLAFLKLLLYRWQLAEVCGAVFVVYLTLKVSRWRYGAWISALLLGSSTLALFLVNKLPALSNSGRWTPLSVTLTAIGFSYVALRLADMLRTVLVDKRPPPSLPATVNYLLPFHMLAAGPIQNYDDFLNQPPVPAPLTLPATLTATERITRGLVKKFILASAIQSALLTGFTVPGWYFILEVQLFYVWLYLDFSALSDIAVGIGGLLGIATPENFNNPFLARNMINFWDRWHISLSLFIRRNVYIPLQLWLVRRAGLDFALWCSTIALAVAFTLCGLWHGVTVRFLMWGLWHAVGVIAATLYRQYLTRKLGMQGFKRYMQRLDVRVIATIITFEYVAFSLVIIQAPLSTLWPWLK
ncbi:MAG: hypothetical protein K8T91_08900 [Planctomycetes bacterium]|nr:hypothetical protein [Planctomycetota bacterium]